MDEFSVKIDWNKAEVMAHLTWLERDQFPYAHAKALTRLAKESAEEVRKRTREKFELKTDFIPKGIAIKPALKSTIVTQGEASSEVFTKERVGEFMVKHEEGGTRLPSSSSTGGGTDKGAALALPGKGKGGSQFSSSKEARKRLETASGKIRRSKTPSALLQDFKGQDRGNKTQAIKRGGRKGSPFIVTGKNSGVPMIVRRIGKKRYPIEILYIFRTSADYKATWGMVETVTDYVHANYDRIFREEMKKAVEEAV